MTIRYTFRVEAIDRIAGVDPPPADASLFGRPLTEEEIRGLPPDAILGVYMNPGVPVAADVFSRASLGDDFSAYWDLGWQFHLRSLPPAVLNPTALEQLKVGEVCYLELTNVAPAA